MPKVPPYSDEFKREAVKLLRSGERSVPQLAKPESTDRWGGSVRFVK